mmetsp:Transcript_63095/g.205911  ORF Transcript_63095/g.205911 Transcript_63095/m.205911 type:complete len:307 (-) Transcript_63095:519-1439(-)
MQFLHYEFELELHLGEWLFVGCAGQARAVARGRLDRHRTTCEFLRSRPLHPLHPVPLPPRRRETHRRLGAATAAGSRHGLSEARGGGGVAVGAVRGGASVGAAALGAGCRRRRLRLPGRLRRATPLRARAAGQQPPRGRSRLAAPHCAWAARQRRRRRGRSGRPVCAAGAGPRARHGLLAAATQRGSLPVALPRPRGIRAFPRGPELCAVEGAADAGLWRHGAEPQRPSPGARLRGLRRGVAAGGQAPGSGRVPRAEARRRRGAERGQGLLAVGGLPRLAGRWRLPAPRSERGAHRKRSRRWGLRA